MIKYLDLKRINDLHDAELRQAVSHVLDSGWYLRGEATRLFEQHYAEYIGTRHCIGCGNGLDALTLILRGYIELGVMAPGDEVIVPATTFIASILAITDCGLRPVLVDASSDTLQIDDSLIEAAITPRTRALMIVHLYGRCAYTPLIGDICRRHHLKLIEDNAQAHGCRFVYAEAPSQLCSVYAEAPSQSPSVCAEAPFQSRRTGSLGDAAGHSFYPGKNLGALGDAGAVTTDDDNLAEVIRAIANYGSREKYVHLYQGRNSRIDELQAAMLDVKLRYLDAENQRRKEIASIYINKVENPLIRIPQSCRDSVWHIFPVLCPQRDALQRYLLDNGVQTQVHYPIPPHRQQCYRQAWPSLSLPVTELISAQELSLPCHQAMTAEEAGTIASLLNAFRP